MTEAAGPCHLWSTEELKEAFACTYRDAALAGADMRLCAQVLEDLRDALKTAERPLHAWRALDNALVVAYGAPHGAAITELHDALNRSVEANWTARIAQSFKENPEAGWQALCAAYACALAGEWGLCAALVQPDYGLEADYAQRVASLRQSSTWMQADMWLHAYPALRALADERALDERDHASLQVTLGNIQLYRARRPAVAKDHYDRAQDMAPGASTTALGLGNYWMEQEDAGTAIEYYQDAIEADPDDGRAYVSLGDYYQTTGKPDVAARWYLEAVSRNPSCLEGLVSLIRQAGRALPSLEECDPVPVLVAKVCLLDPLQTASVMSEAAEAYLQREMKDEAYSWFGRAIEADPAHPRAYVRMSEDLIGRGEMVAAADLLERGLARSADTASLYAAKAYLLQQQREYGGARQAYIESDARQPGGSALNKAKAALMRGESGDWEAAFEDGLEALRQNPAETAVQEVVEDIIGGHFEAARELGASLRLYRRILRVCGDAYRPRYHDAVGRLLLGAGEYARAQRQFRQAIKAEPGRPIYYINLASSLLAAKDWEAVEVLWKDAPPVVQADYTFYSWIAAVYNRAGNARYEAGDYARAVSWYTKALAIDPEDAVVHSNLSRAYQYDSQSRSAADRIAMALASSREARRLDPGNQDYAQRLNQLSVLQDAAETYGPATLDRFPTLIPLALEIADDLVPLVVRESETTIRPQLVSVIDGLRGRIADHFGVTLPGIRIRGSEALDSGTYVVRIMEVPLDVGAVRLDRRLTPASAQALADIGVSREPAVLPPGMGEAWWVAPEDCSKIQEASLPLWETMEYPMRHLEGLVRQHLADFLDNQTVSFLLSEQCSDLLGQVQGQPGGLAGLAQVLRALLMEGIPIKPVRVLCERYLEASRRGCDIVATTEYLRRAPELADCLPGLRSPRWLQVGPLITRALSGGVRGSPGVPILALEPELCQNILTAVQEAYQEGDALWVEQADLRPYLRLLVEAQFPLLHVLGGDEARGARSPVVTVDLEA